MIVMNTRIYLRASTKDQDAQRALQILQDLNQDLNLGEITVYMENYSGTKLDRPELNKLLSEANKGDTEPYRVCRRVNILRDYSDEKTKLYPRN